jgi:sugar/nucleoside kinase (ribokinase family)
VETRHAPRVAEGAAVHSTIVVGTDTGSRNVFYEAAGVIGAHDNLPAEEVIRSTAVLFIDNYGMPGNLRAARIARDAGIPVVADFEEDGSPLFGEVMACVDHLILSEDFALRITRAKSPVEAASALWSRERTVVIVTCGAQGAWSVSHAGNLEPRHHPALAVPAKDTTGCGDVFHGAYAASLAKGGSLEDNIRCASAAAAWKAAHSESPTRRELETFLRTDPTSSRPYEIQRPGSILGGGPG